MPSTPPYRPTEPPDSPTHDSDSDLDLDIQELDPISSEPARGSRRDPPAAEQKTSRIALRNLRMGGLRRANKRGRGYGDLGANRDDVDDHTRGLLDEHDGSGNGDDDAPLLGGDQRSRSRRPSRSSLRLPSFMSGSKKADDEGPEEQEDDPSASRLVAVGSNQATRFPTNFVSNAKYTALTFLPVTLYNEFSFFFNMYFLLVALSQVIPALRIGYLSTYVAPLAFVLCITMGKEAYDDIARRRRDTEANSEEYKVLLFSDPESRPAALRPRRPLRSDTVRRGARRPRGGRQDLSDIQEEDERHEPAQPSSYVQEVSRKSKDLKVGDVLKLSKGQRVPSDVVILQCYTSDGPPAVSTPTKEPEEEEALLAFAEGEQDSKGKQPAAAAENEAETGSVGETFIRTDQLDGETDWKLRLASPLTQHLAPEEFVRLRVTGGKPDKKVNEFVGNSRAASHEARCHKSPLRAPPRWRR